MRPLLIINLHSHPVEDKSGQYYICWRDASCIMQHPSKPFAGCKLHHATPNPSWQPFAPPCPPFVCSSCAYKQRAEHINRRQWVFFANWTSNQTQFSRLIQMFFLIVGTSILCGNILPQFILPRAPPSIYMHSYFPPAIADPSLSPLFSIFSQHCRPLSSGRSKHNSQKLLPSIIPIDNSHQSFP